MTLRFEKKDMTYDYWEGGGLSVQFQMPKLDGQEQILTQMHCSVNLQSDMMSSDARVAWARFHDPPGKVLSERTLTFFVPLDSSKLIQIEHARRNMDRHPRDVYLVMKGWMSFLVSHSESPTDRKTYYYEPFSEDFELYESGRKYIRIPETDWLNYYDKTGGSVASLVVTDRTARKLSDLRARIGATDDESFVDRIVEALSELDTYRSGIELNQSLLWTLPEDKSIRNKVEEILSRAAGEKGDVLICGFVDSAVEPRLMEVLRQGGQVRILVRKGRSGGQEVDRAVGEVLERLKRAGANVEYRNMLHARALIGKSECLISSADLKTDSLDKNREIGVFTTDPRIVQRATTFFEKVWSED